MGATAGVVKIRVDRGAWLKAMAILQAALESGRPSRGGLSIQIRTDDQTVRVTATELGDEPGPLPGSLSRAHVTATNPRVR